ncbi:MAG: RagB/SusD family nutrient uptake outer membrane protein [Proteobacteria bacterium]|nr:RagB/SusD family nutrient uptake outer membrane protein [Pseudomonadota bacterium]
MNFCNTKYIKPVVIAMFCLMATSCKKFIDISPPADQITTTTVFSDDETATAAINGLYSSMMVQNFSFCNSGMTLYPALSSDELINTVPDANLNAFTANQIPSSNYIVEQSLWKKAYSHIYQVNSIVEGLNKSTGVSVSVKKQLSGEAKFARAFSYFYLVNIFGEVPLITATDYKINSTISRTSIDKVYQQIVSDLQEATQLLDASYPSAGKLRPNKWAASTLLARVYLYQKKWDLAEQLASDVISSGMYSLTALSDVFVADSDEAIWQLLPILTYLNTADGFGFIPYSSSVQPSYIATNWLLNAFEANDLRKTNWLNSNTVNGNVFYYPYKYKVRSGSSVSEYNMVFRLAELYLIRAEARAEQNNLSGAISDIDTIRTRAGLPNTMAGTQTELLDAVQKERQVEFFAEWGHRWFDLKRTQHIDAVLGFEKTGWSSSAALYPIPISELKLNLQLTQNPGY